METEIRNFTVEAQKILSCIYRMGKPYPLELVMKVLMGEQDTAIFRMEFNEISTYGILRRYDRQYVRCMLESLLKDGYVKRQKNGYVWLTQKARGVLFDGEQVITELPIEKYRKKPILDEKTKADLLDALTEYLNSILVPGYVISEAQIQEVADAMPETHYEFMEVFRGEFFHQYEKEILELIADFL